MQKNVMWKWLILIALVAGSLAVTYPPFDKKDAQGNVTKPGRIKLGLDLRGGTSFLVEVDKDDLRKKIQERGESLSEERIQSLLASEAKAARDVALEAIRNRVDGLGISEPQIFPQLDSRIVIQMPGISAKKREEARRSIESVAFLEFRLVHKNSASWTRKIMDDQKVPRGFRLSSDERDSVYVRDRESLSDDKLDLAYWAELRRFAPHEGGEFMLQKDEAQDGSTIYRPFYVETVQQLTGKGVRNARVDYDQMNRPKISLEFNKVGKRRFAQVTRDYAPRGDKNREGETGRQLAIILDNTLYSAPVINEEINSGSAEITGSFSITEAKRLVNVLKTGALLAPIRIVEERSVDPSLGRDSISSGVRASIIGTIAVILFMLVYYRIPGIIANIALILDAILLPLSAVVVAGFLGILTGGGGSTALELPTLTLPGIAGIALTFGMAVDANVLIYERMREELRAGKHLGPAIEAGYDRAFVTILDSNLTTLLAAVIMFWQGSGAIRGYAITLSAGIIVSMFTAVVVTRMLFTYLVEHHKITTLKMMDMIQVPKIDFLGQRKWAISVSVILLAVSWGVFAARGKANFGVDFIGGASLTYEFAQKQGTDVVREALTAAGVREPSPQYQQQYGTVGGPAKELLVLNVGFEDGDKAVAAMNDKFGAAGYKLLSKDQVGPQIGSELKRKGLIALMWSMIGMIIYISWRFEFGFAMGAIVALLHDALMAVGVFCLLGRQLSSPMIAVVLTIVGYSVNDTIVIFDRIREATKLNRSMKFLDVCNLAINQTLGRTILTTGATMLSVLALLIFGGGAMNDFALLLVIGMVAGTYSTIFIATPVMLLWHRAKPGAEAERVSAQKMAAKHAVKPAKATA